MAIFKRQPKPQDCSLSNVTITSGIEQRIGEPVHKPILRSEAYHDTLQRRGRYDEWYYRSVADGQFTVETPVAEYTVFTGAFSCRRTQNNPNLAAPAERTGYHEAAVVDNVYGIAKELGLCATCPYLGMSEIEADEYDGRANRAEAERLISEKLLAEARQELQQFTAQNGGQIS